MTYVIISEPMTAIYAAPDIPTDQITPILVRNELLRCFESANREFMRLLAQPITDQALRTQVQQFVNGVFQKCGVNYDNPTRQGILTAINECKQNAEAMMGPQGSDIIQHHYQEMMKLVEKLPDSFPSL